MITRNSVIVVCTPFTSVCRSSLMSLIITFMFEPAKLQMNCASASGAMNARGEPTQGAADRGSSVGVALAPSGDPMPPLAQDCDQVALDRTRDRRMRITQTG